jgi:hypothetical protein
MLRSSPVPVSSLLKNMAPRTIDTGGHRRHDEMAQICWQAEVLHVLRTSREGAEPMSHPPRDLTPLPDLLHGASLAGPTR